MWLVYCRKRYFNMKYKYDLKNHTLIKKIRYDGNRTNRTPKASKFLESFIVHKQCYFFKYFYSFVEF